MPYEIIFIFGFVYIVLGLYHGFKPLPKGLNARHPLRQPSDVKFLADQTFLNQDGIRESEQEIFDEVFRLIQQAKKLIVMDWFLFNNFAGAGNEAYRPLSLELTELLLKKKRAIPDLRIVFIFDPFNTIYGGTRNTYLEQLESAGVELVCTNLNRLRDSIPAWSSIWRIIFSWAGNSIHGWLPNPVGQDRVSLRTYLTMLNLKANHRKTIVVDFDEDWMGLVTSGNPHDASSAHDNVALRFNGQAALDILITEQAVAQFSSNNFTPFVTTAISKILTEDDNKLRLQILTEKAIGDAIIDTLGNSSPGDHLDIIMFYFSHRTILKALIAAWNKGIKIRILLDPSEDAFGRKKNGIPNRQIANELHSAGIPVRWCDTHGEQCHSKLIHLRKQNNTSTLILGSANLTRRNIDNLNLETSLRLYCNSDHSTIQSVMSLFEQQWNNLHGKNFSAPYEQYADHSFWRYCLYRFMEATGFSSF